MISVSHEALKYIKELLVRHHSTNDGICLHDVRLIVEKTGCSGSKYSLVPITVFEICDLNSTCFIVDSLTIWYDRIDEGLIHGCDINILVNNLLPTINITNPKLKIEMCGCGESFIVNQDS